MDRIIVKGARVHNLKNIDVEIPRGKLVVITGLSGSGKSSLAFDTIYAEGQRRFVESLSVHARQFLEQMSKPDVDSIDGLSPAIAIEQQHASQNPRSTVGTVTEVYDYLRLLFARVGEVECHGCGLPIRAQTVPEMVEQALALPAGMRFSVIAPLVRDKVGDFARELADLRRRGFTRVAIDGALCDLAEGLPKLDPLVAHTVDVWVDRLVAKGGIAQRLGESLALALELGGGVARVAPLDGDDLIFTERFACVACGVSYPELTPRVFSFNSPHGACPACDGIGARLFFDPALVVPDPELSLREGAIEPWDKRNAAFHHGVLETVAAEFKIDMLESWSRLPEEQRQIVLHGSPGVELEFVFERSGRRQTFRKEWSGVLAQLEQRFAEHQRRRREDGRAADSLDDAHEELYRYMGRSLCAECSGTRLRRECRFVKIGGRSLPEVAALSLDECHAFFRNLVLSKREQKIAARILADVGDRLGFLVDVGVGYLSLDRSAGTLSGGEGQRIRLATQIGSPLVGVLYVLDEPSIGLHPRDHERLLATLMRLRDRGNTVLVVEHDEATIRAADYVVDMGPRAGVEGGEVIASGTPKEIEACAASLTGAYLSGRRRIPMPSTRRQPMQRYVTVRGARAHNLRGVTARFPIGLFTCVTGVSGSGKSSLVVDTLLPALAARLGGARAQPGPHDGLDGVAHLDKVIAIDQAPIGRTPRSNPATYTGLFTHIRELFAGVPESRARGYKLGRYSFNVKGGRCESRHGDGILRIEMHFLPAVYVECEACGGRRYNRDTLEVLYKGKSIADLLDLSVAQASELLAQIPKVRQKLDTMRQVGLGYLTLGQSATTLSGGEAQRLKLARELARKATGRTLYVLDEPTTGLHFDDIKQLLAVLQELAEQGNTVVVIEHNLDVIRRADWVIDLGPEGGAGGGEIVAEGTPDEIMRVAASRTGRCLKALR